ncbi:hypothetical protein BpHYR1_031730 [Brachionus plicatilis]|uniref:Uncharacterized protein n=1 Tax=Brachionus plicatilis TaxID=10195 RepID=A0A3M7PY78_BRAPC|nr:hypothetical protein BpHYR1_031730 [Brachionus plicatilis]
MLNIILAVSLLSQILTLSIRNWSNCTEQVSKFDFLDFNNDEEILIRFEIKFIPNNRIDLTDELQLKTGGTFDVTTIDSPIFLFSNIELILNGHEISITKDVIDSKVFGGLTYLTINGHVKNIDWQNLLKFRNLIAISLNIYELNKFLYENQNWFEYKSITLEILLDTNENPCNCLLQWLKICESKDLNSTCDYKMLENNCKNLQVNSFKSKMTFTLYNFMTVCSIVNLFYCLILAFHIMNSCTVINGIFCSSLYGNVLVQYYEIYLVDFLCGILRTLSNILNIWISLFRCFIIDDKSKFFNLITKLAKSKNGDFDPDYYGFPMRNWFITEDVEVSTDYYGFETKKLSKNRFFFLFVINVLFNGIILWTILLISDVYLLLKFKEQLNISKRFWTQSSNQDAKIGHLRSIQDKIVKMTIKIWLNNLILCLFHFGNLFYIASCSYSIMIYYFLNKPFKNVFRKIFGIVNNETKKQNKNEKTQ